MFKLKNLCLLTDRRSGFPTGQYDSFRKRPKDDLLAGRSYSTDRGRVGYEKRRSWSPDDYGSSLSNFRPVTLTVSSFFKQVILSCGSFNFQIIRKFLNSLGTANAVYYDDRKYLLAKSLNLLNFKLLQTFPN